MPSGSPTRRQGGGASRSTGNRPLYAIDFTAVACGKRIANTKRRVRWRFGFANPDALAAGETGTACRGEEHDVTLVWSVTSGKRLILADGQEVHYSNSRSAVIDFSWTMRGNHVLKVVAHATAPMSAEPGFRQYDFFVDGRSFFSFPKVYRLGLSGSKTISPNQGGGHHIPTRNAPGMAERAESSGRRKGPGGGGGSGTIAAIEAPHNPDEEEAYLREAIKASLADEAQRKGGDNTPDRPKISAEAADMLIDFMDDFDAGAAPAATPGVPAATSNEWALAPTAQPANQWAAPPPPAQPDNSWAMASPQPPAPVQHQQPSYDQFGGSGGAPPAFAGAPANPFAPAPVQQQPPPPPPAQTYASPAPPAQNFAAPAPADPFGAPAYAQPAAPGYGQPAPAVAPVAADPFAPAPPAAAWGSPAQESPQKQFEPAPVANGAAAPTANPALTMGSLTSDGLLASNNPTPAAATNGGAGGSLADKALQNLMGSIDSFGITGSAAKPPAAANNPFDTNNIMSNATLGEIKSAKSGDQKKSIMNAAPGAMVMASSQGGNWGGYGGQQAAAGQYGGMGGSGGMQASPPPQYAMSGGYPQQQPQMGGMQQQQQPGMMGQQPQMGMMGQQPPMQQPQPGYGAPPQQYGQQPPMQQNQWGAPSY